MRQALDLCRVCYCSRTAPPHILSTGASCNNPETKREVPFDFLAQRLVLSSAKAMSGVALWQAMGGAALWQAMGGVALWQTMGDVVLRQGYG